MLLINELPIEVTKIYPSSSFKGLEILFRIENHDYHFLIGNSTKPFPLSVKHIFKEKDVCPFCQKNIYAAPLGQQICLEFQKNLPILLKYFQKKYPDIF